MSFWLIRIFVIPILLLVGLVLVLGCKTKGEFVSNQVGQKIEIRISTDRYAMVCEPLETGHDGFMMYLLDNNKKLVTFIQTNQMSRSSCEKRERRIRKMANDSEWLYLAGMGTLEEKIDGSEKKIEIPGHGNFKESGSVIQLMYLASSNGECFSAFVPDSTPCPKDEFPLPNSLYQIPRLNR